MKLRYIFAAVAAGALTLAGCSEDYEVDNLSGLQVSSSYVSIPQDGGADTITISSNDTWQLDTTGTQTGATPWLRFSSLNGQAGKTELVVSADGTLDGRTAEVRLISGSKTQRINIIQGLTQISNATCAEVIAGPDGKSYRVTGTVTAIANTSYGNFYLQDATGTIYIYGTKDASNNYNWKSFNIDVGDEVTVQGPKSTYNGTVELVDAQFISVNKSLIKVDSTYVGGVNTSNIPTEGGDITAYLTLKGGDGVHVSVPEDAQSWLSLKSVNGNKVVFHATANTAGPRSTTLTFTTTQSGKEYSSQTTITQAGAAGTKELPFTVEEAIAYVNSIGGNTPTEVYVKGIVSQIANNGQFNANYGNGTFYISSDGEYHNDKSLDFEVFRALWLGNKKWAQGNQQIAVGSEVIIHGTLTVYNGTPETASGKAYVLSINGVENEANGIGTLESPFNVAGAIEACKAGTSSDVYINGTVSQIANNGQFGAAYGNGTFWISDDGTYHGDKSLDFEAYRVKWLGNNKWVEGDPQVAAGDNVTLHGKVTLYNGTAETASGKAYVYSYNGKTAAKHHRK